MEPGFRGLLVDTNETILRMRPEANPEGQIRIWELPKLGHSYVIGADGPRSAVRDVIGAKMMGEGAFSKNYSIIFRSPELAKRQVHERAIM